MIVPKPKKLTKLERHKRRMDRKRATKLRNKQKTQKYWIILLDKIIGNECRARGHCENPHCKFQGLGYAIQWAHIISRSYHATRWDLENCLCLCSGCHKYYTEHPLEWEVFVNELLPGELSRLKLKALSKPKMTRIELEELYGILKNRY